MLDDVLRSAQLTWNDIKIVWTKDLTGTPETPAELFRKRTDIDACFAITPDMAGLTGGLRVTGTGAEGTVRGARVLVSTAELSRSIADVYAVRKDFYDAHKDVVTKFVAGYLKAVEEIIELRKEHESRPSTAFRSLLQLTQDIYGRTVIPTLDDAAGLLADATFVGYPGNVSFFTQAGNLSGFEALNRNALDLATSRGYARQRFALFPSGLDYQSPEFTSYLTKTTMERGERFRAEAVREDIEALSGGAALDDRTILAFTIGFEPNQMSFSAEQYGAEFNRVVELADKFGNAVIAIRGHADPTKTLLDLVRSGLAKGVLKRSGTAGNYSYSLRGSPLDLSATGTLVGLIESGSFDGSADANPRETMQSALNLSRSRAEAVRDSILAYAKARGLSLDSSQIQPMGVGIREPFIAKPANMDDARKNMRVEFRLIRVPAEATKPADFDF
jgi:outer membrane protein OmpA-like peptidoglycan-associated protein